MYSVTCMYVFQTNYSVSGIQLLCFSLGKIILPTLSHSMHLLVDGNSLCRVEASWAFPCFAMSTVDLFSPCLGCTVLFNHVLMENISMFYVPCCKCCNDFVWQCQWLGAWFHFFECVPGSSVFFQFLKLPGCSIEWTYRLIKAKVLVQWYQSLVNNWFYNSI